MRAAVLIALVATACRALLRPRLPRRMCSASCHQPTLALPTGVRGPNPRSRPERWAEPGTLELSVRWPSSSEKTLGFFFCTWYCAGKVPSFNSADGRLTQLGPYYGEESGRGARGARGARRCGGASL